jgi:tetratricopeptide (TPR) repeat protein
MRGKLIIVLLLTASGLRAQTPQQWRDSLAVLNRMISEQPRSTDLRLKKAAVNIELNQWEYAVEEYGRVLTLDEKNLAALFFRAYGLNTLRRYGEARADYERFLQIAPVNLEARLGLATVLENLSRKTEALDELNRAVQMFPQSASAYAARAVMEAKLRQVEPALFDWTEAIRLEPSNIGYVVSKVDLLLQQGRRREARQELDAAVGRGEPRNNLKEWFDRCR